MINYKVEYWNKEKQNAWIEARRKYHEIPQYDLQSIKTNKEFVDEKMNWVMIHCIYISSGLQMVPMIKYEFRTANGVVGEETISVDEFHNNMIGGS